MMWHTEADFPLHVARFRVEVKEMTDGISSCLQLTSRSVWRAGAAPHANPGQWTAIAKQTKNIQWDLAMSSIISPVVVCPDLHSQAWEAILGIMAVLVHPMASNSIMRYAHTCPMIFLMWRCPQSLWVSLRDPNPLFYVWHCRRLGEWARL